MMATLVRHDKPKRSAFDARSLVRLGLTYLALAILDAMALFLVYAFASDGVWELAITVGVITLIVNVINLRGDLYPLRWISPALALMGLMVVFPIIYTVYVSLTNYGDGNLLTKQQVINRLAQETYLPEGGKVYLWNLYQNSSGDFALWLTDEADGDRYFFATSNALDAVDTIAPGTELPQEYQGYRRLSRAEALRASGDAQDQVFGTEDVPIGIASRKQAGEFAQRYVFQPEQDAVFDHKLQSLFYANYDTGQFENDEGKYALDRLHQRYRTEELCPLYQQSRNQRSPRAHLRLDHWLCPGIGGIHLLRRIAFRPAAAEYAHSLSQGLPHPVDCSLRYPGTDLGGDLEGHAQSQPRHHLQCHSLLWPRTSSVLH